MSTMSFMPRLKEFLLEEGVIYTVRKYQMVQAVVDIQGVGRCNRSPLGQVQKEGLLPYVELSGFLTLEDWWAKIKYFIPEEKTDKFLYKVEVIR